jgi:hypothetical protein
MLLQSDKRGIPGYLGSLDCCHLAWKNCPRGWSGQYSGKEGIPTIVMEVVAGYNLHIWHLMFGFPGSLNDINILQRSNFIENMVLNWPEQSYTLNGIQRNKGYWFVDGIYPRWSMFQTTLDQAGDAKKAFYQKIQEVIRKEEERAFGVLKARFHILSKPIRLWSTVDIN